MDQIDTALTTAWNNITSKCKQDRIESLRRFTRTQKHKKSVTIPIRPWSLCLRASDTRLSHLNTFVEPLPKTILSPDDSTDSLIKNHQPHQITITGETLRNLMQPVNLPWPGLDWTIAAEKLGRHSESLRAWIKSGAIQLIRKDNAVSLGKRGKPVPIVWAPSPLDPNANEGQPPDTILWGSLWQSMYQQIPENYSITIIRVPRYHNYNTKTNHPEIRFRGWDWLCPGCHASLDLKNINNRNTPTQHNRIPCGNRVHCLYLPLTVWSVPQALGDRLNLRFPDDSKLKGTWSPGFHDPLLGKRTFACRHCWNLRRISLTHTQGWNEFISHLSAGLLFGSEVPRPEIVSNKESFRKRKYTPRPRANPHRDQILQLLISEPKLTYKQIATRLNICYETVSSNIQKIYRTHNVHSRKELLQQSSINFGHVNSNFA